MGAKAQTVLIVDGNRQFCLLLQQEIQKEPDLVCVGVVHDGRSALREIDRLDPDLVVLDLVLPYLDGLAVLEQAREMDIESKFLVVTAFGTDDFLKRSLRLGADCFLMKPLEWEILIKHIRETIHGGKIAKDEDEQIAEHSGITENMITDALGNTLVERMIAERITELGVPAHYKGYRYLKDAIAMVIYDVELLGQMTKVLYPTVAKNHQSTSAKVERSMRHAIETAWSRGDMEILHRAFGYSVDANRGRPSNSSFVAKIADDIRLELRAKGEDLN
ncbi:MAG: sporulation transcription factor Spo0A [Firmicutes bacterium]|nr:sporulation transcription factor Spo0A [Bacillota bacterium]